MLHVDIGITAMGMNTDTQHLAYILRRNETEPPGDLIRGLHNSNRMQDLNRQEMVPGRTGDDVFFRIKDDMKRVGLDGDIYSHPIGDYGHSAGAVIGMANWQDCKSEIFGPSAQLNATQLSRAEDRTRSWRTTGPASNLPAARMWLTGDVANA